MIGLVRLALSELRVHALRNAVAALGLAVGLTAWSLITVAGAMNERAVQEYLERTLGRPATMELQVPSTDVAFYEDALESMGVVLWSPLATYEMPLHHQGGVLERGAVVGVRPLLDRIRFIEPVAGRWLLPGDADRLGVVVVLNQAAAEAFGGPTAAVGRRVRLDARGPEAAVVGVIGRDAHGTLPVAYAVDAVVEDAFGGSPAPDAPRERTLLARVPPEQADAFSVLLGRRAAAAGRPAPAVKRVDTSDELRAIPAQAKGALLAVAAVTLVIGLLGVVNLGLVAVRQRVSEIGLLRAVGARPWQVAGGVLLESLVLVVTAGVVGVAAAYGALRVYPDLALGDLPPAESLPLPVDAVARVGAVVACIGIVAGVLPALRALRVAVVDALRY